MEELAAVARAFAKLPPIQQHILLAVLDGEELASIAGKLGISQPSVSRHLERALQAMRDVEED